MVRPAGKRGHLTKGLTLENLSVRRLRSLDVLRALAIVLVIGRHLDYCPPSFGVFHRVAASWYFGGWVGVDLFFVLSGFLISSLLFDEHRSRGAISFKRFFIRRGFKIYPPLYVLCVATLIFGWSAGPRPFTRFLHEILFVQNYLDPLWFHTWSLAVEEHFYLVLPWLLIFLAQRGKDRPFAALPGLCLFVAAACLAARIATRTAHPEFSVRTHLVPTHLRADSLFFGVLLSYWSHYHRQAFEEWVRRLGWALPIAGGLLLAPAFVLPLERNPLVFTLGFTLFYLGSGMLVAFCAVREDVFAPAFWKLPAAIGRHSYSIYLWHMFIIFCAKAVLPYYGGNWPLYFALTVSGCVVMGMVMARLVEFPSLRLRQKLFP